MKNKREKNKKGYYFILDAIFASLLLVAGLVALGEYSSKRQYIQESEFFSQDLLTVLSSIKIYELNETNKNNSFVVAEINLGNITNQENSILEQLGEYWAIGEPDKARILLDSLMTQIDLDKNYEIIVSNAYRTDYDTIYNTSPMQDFDTVTASRRMISGIEKGSPLSGYSSSSYLKKIQSKRTFSYFYFGGFIGQGDIRFFIDNLPSDLNSSNVKGIMLEGFYGGNFTLEINGNTCYTATGTNFTASSNEYNNWSITHCNSSILPYRNDFKMHFTSSLDNNYIVGGFLRLDYLTNQISTNISYGKGKYNFPGVYGVANIYDSFYVPGTLNEISVLLHFNSSYNTYLTIGERIILINDTGSNVTVVLNDSYLRNTVLLDYDKLSSNTVPIRFASYNTTLASVVFGDADVVLITDFSGSMKKAVESWEQGNLGASCDEVFYDSRTRRTNLAKCVDDEFVDTIMNYSGNRVWPVFIFFNEIRSYNNPTDEEGIHSYINSYVNGAGKTCLACALNKAYDLLSNYSDPSRKKFVILMTDGTPTHCAQGSCYSNSSIYGLEYCPGLCDFTGACDYLSIPPACENCTENTQPAFNVNLSALRLRNDLNATIYTVGFGPVDDCPVGQAVLEAVADIGNGTYQSSNSSMELRLIYQNLSNSILSMVEQSNQSLLIPGNLTISTLFEDSYINYSYTPISDVNVSQSISVNIELSLPNCSTIIEIPEEIILIDSKVVSYSGLHWADLLVINNVTVFNLSDYYVPYARLGDPLVIYARTEILNNGFNNIFVETGDSVYNRTGCSPHNKLIFTGLIPSTTSRTTVLEKREGCKWIVAFEDDTIAEILVPLSYVGTKICSYQPGNITYDSLDSYDVAVYALFNRLDLMNNGKVYVNLVSQDLEVIVTTIDSVPYLWGPSIIEVRVWR